MAIRRAENRSTFVEGCDTDETPGARSLLPVHREAGPYGRLSRPHLGSLVDAEHTRALIAKHEVDCLARCARSLATPTDMRRRLLGTDPLRRHPEASRGMLQNWRLVRVTHFVNANLGQRITLADIASAAGLSPMHFAARFRATTGHKPHEFLQRCRIERAKHLLAEGNRSLIDIAMEVGFRTQAHFTTVFKRLAGRTPHSWRLQRRNHALL